MRSRNLITELDYGIILRNCVTGWYFGIILQNVIMESYYGIILRIYISELYQGMLLRNHIAEIHYGTIVRSYITELYYGIILGASVADLYQRINPWRGTQGSPGRPCSRLETLGTSRDPWGPSRDHPRTTETAISTNSQRKKLSIAAFESFRNKASAQGLP